MHVNDARPRYDISKVSNSSFRLSKKGDRDL